MSSVPTSFQNIKDLKFVITLGTGTFGSSNNNQITMQGFRARVYVDKAGAMQMGQLKAEIYGVSQSDMNSATTLQWKPGFLINNNTIDVYAIDGARQSLIFQGNIINAWGNYQSMPAVFLQINAQTAYRNKLQPVAPLSFKGQIDVATIMSQLANTMGLTFENNGVNVQLTDVYLANTALEQAKTLAKMAGIWLYVDDTTLAITPLNTPRSSPIPLISAKTGMKGYPTFDGIGVNFDMEFNPAVQFGGQIQVETDIQQAAGNWIVTSVSHRLSSIEPGGEWFTRVRGNKSGLAITS